MAAKFVYLDFIVMVADKHKLARDEYTVRLSDQKTDLPLSYSVGHIGVGLMVLMKTNERSTTDSGTPQDARVVFLILCIISAESAGPEEEEAAAGPDQRGSRPVPACLPHQARKVARSTACQEPARLCRRSAQDH